MWVYSTATLAWGDFELVFKTRETLGEGFFHILQDVKGFYTGASVKGEIAERSWGDGAYISRRYRGARKVTLEGTLFYKDDLERHQASNMIVAALADGRAGELTVDVQGIGPLSMPVYIDGEFDHRFYSHNAIQISIPMVSPSPYRFGPKQTATMVMAGFGEGLVYPLGAPTKTNLNYGDSAPESHVVLYNNGTAPAHPVYRVQGDWPSGFTIIAGGKTLEFDAPVYRQSPVTVDMAGTVTQGGSDVTYLLKKREWHSVMPDSALYPRITSLQRGTGWCEIDYRDTYY